jgi:hypothetical protein
VTLVELRQIESPIMPAAHLDIDATARAARIVALESIPSARTVSPVALRTAATVGPGSRLR